MKVNSSNSMSKTQKLVDIQKFINESRNYKKSVPFPFCVVNNIWCSSLLKKAEEEINNFKDWDGEKKFYGSVGKRFCNTFEKLPESVKEIVQLCNSPAFINGLETITGERGLIPDPFLEGGGIHSTNKNGFLKMHTDFNWYSKLKLYRRLNFIIYLNSGWEESWKGNLKLALKKKNKIKVYSEVEPIFNRSILFTTTSKTYHGHPDKLCAPLDRSRNSIAIYYYVSERPKGTYLFKRTGTVYRRIQDGKKFVGELSLKNFPSKIKSFFKLMMSQ